MTAAVTPQEVLAILREQSTEVEQRLPVSPVQLSMPTDGKGARIKVSVRAGQATRIPRNISLQIGGKSVQVPLEAVEDFQDYALF